MKRQFGYKKYMKKEAKKDNSLLNVFLVSFFAMLLVFTFIFKSLIPSVDTSIGDYSQEQELDNSDDMKKIVDDRLSMIQNDDREKSFSEEMKKADDVVVESKTIESPKEIVLKDDIVKLEQPKAEPIYKVFVGSYSSVEQAKVAKEIIQESGTNLNPIVKCIGSNNYTLQVGIFKNKQSAETLLSNVLKNHLPGRIVEND